MDEQRFFAAFNAVTDSPGGIGTLSERTLHALLKRYFEPDVSCHEIPVSGYIADIARADGIIEIQTRDFSRLLSKLPVFLELGRVTVVYPIAAVKRLRWIDVNTGEVSAARKSPKRGALYDALPELYKIRPLAAHPNFRLCVVMLELEELRYLNGWGNGGKRGSERCDRIPSALVDEVYFQSPGDFQKMLPDTLARPFTVKDFMSAAKRSRYQASLAVGALRAIGAVSVIEKRGRAFVYDVAGACPNQEGSILCE